MSPLVFELNDAALTWGRDGQVIASEPGYALYEGDQVLTGNDAYQKAHLKPRQINNRFWDELTVDAGDSSAGMAPAELAYTHLQRMWAQHGKTQDSVIVVAPPHYERQQLGLLLGLAQECQMPIAGLIHRSVAWAEQPHPGRQLITLDGGLHRVTAAVIEQGESASLGRIEHLDRVGIAELWDRWARRVAELFVLTTRFDPLHRAEVEQLLHDRLPSWLATLRNSDSVNVELEGHELILDRQQLLSATESPFGAVAQLVSSVREPDRDLILQVAPQLARLPGLVDRLGQLERVQIRQLEPGHIVANLTGVEDFLPSAKGGVRLSTTLPWRKPPADGGPVPAPTPAKVTVPEEIVSHVVYAGVGHVIGEQGLTVGREPGQRGLRLGDGNTTNGVSAIHFELTRRGKETFLRDMSRYGTLVNDKRVAAETKLKAGDVIRVGDPSETLLAVRIEES